MADDYMSIPGQWNPATNSYNAPLPTPVPTPTPTTQQMQSIPGQYNYATNDYNAPLSNGSVLGANTTGGGQTQPPAQTTNNTGTQSPSGPSPEDQFRSELDAIFNPVFSALQGQENTLNQNYASVPGEIESQYQTAAGSLAQQQQSGMRDLATQEAQAGNRKEDALTAATRLYDELQRGGQQRFGGASSAGEAYGALTAVEQQRRQGTIQGAYETAMQQVGSYKANLNEKYALSLKELENNKLSALNQAQRDFRDALQQIQNAKSQAQSEKATATMNTLQDYRNKVYTINQQSLQFAQALAANQQLSLKAVDDYTAKVAQSLSGGQVAVTNFANQATTNPATNYGVSTPQGTTGAVQQTGQIAPMKRWDINDPSSWY